MPELPTGVVTFLFSDIEGSTRLVQTLGPVYPSILEEHARRIRAALERHQGVEVSTDGDAFFAVFSDPTDAIAAAVDAQRSLANQRLPDGETMKVRMGLHTGFGRLGGENYAGIDVHRAARIAAAAHGGQVVISEATHLVAGGALPPDISARDLGTHRLKDLDQAEHLFQLLIPELPAQFPPLHSIRLGNLPTSLTTFVGRGDLIDVLKQLIPGTNIVTLTGPGGTGKTRLSLETARQLADAFADGVFFVELETIRERELVPLTIVRALELKQKGDDPLPILIDYLRDRQLLLILDNFEQVAAAAPIVAELATGGPRSRFVVTSRVALRLYGEQEFPVPPLELPNPERMPPLAELASYDAVQLFVDRARAVRPDFRLTDDTARPIAELCRRLDGLPLAIELAAARVRMLSPQAIIARLGERLDLLSSGAVNMPERQRSLEGAIGWSVELLDEPPQRLLERLSIFAGGCSIDAAQAVCDPRHELFPDAVAGLETLLVSSLLTSTDTDGEPRFTLLETIREFALRRLRQRSELPGIAARHAAWTADLVEGSEEALRAGRGSQFARIELEYANIQAALRWAIDADAATSGLHICSSIWRFWQRKGLLAEGIWWTRALLELPSAAPRTRERAAALAALGSLSYWTDDAPATASAYDESLEIWQELGDDLGIAIGIYNLAFARMLEGNPDAAKALIRDSKARFEALQDSFWIAEVSNSLGYIEILAGNLDEGEALLRSALPLIAGDPVRQADMWTILAQVEWLRGNFDAARDAVRTGLALLRQSWDAPLALGMSEVRGLLEIAAGNVALGLRLHAGASAMRERIGGGPPVMMINRGTELQDARALLGEEEADRIEAEGRNLTDDEVVTLAEMSQTTSARR